MLEFFGLTKFPDGSFDFIREAEGAWSWQHITFVSICLAVMFALAIFFWSSQQGQDGAGKEQSLNR